MYILMKSFQIVEIKEGFFVGEGVVANALSKPVPITGVV